ncbi:MAG: response regulator [Polyangiaceae bacterium]|jgi:PAS domain S-box-containing protein|nr:response regulator [Polyangiaceae bacterium]
MTIPPTPIPPLTSFSPGERSAPESHASGRAPESHASGRAPESNAPGRGLESSAPGRGLESNAPGRGPGGLAPSKILLVDDQPQNLLALEAILEPLGERLVRAISGPEALKHLLTDEFAVILLDVQMPGMDGFETATLIKEREKTRHVPIIFLTAINKAEQYIYRGYNVGAVDYIAKPFDAEILRSKVSVFVDLYKKNKKVHEQAELLRAAREREVAELRRLGEERYRSLAESMPQIVWTADAGGTLTYGNRRWFDCAKRPPGEADALAWRAVLPPEDGERFEADWWRAVQAGQNWEAEFRFGSPGSGYRWHLVRAVPCLDAGGQIGSWIGTSTDIDDRRRAEDRLRLLSEASRLLASASTGEGGLVEVARLAIATLADYCSVDLVDEEGVARGAVVVHRDEARVGAAEQILRALDEAPGGPFGAARAMKTKRAQHLTELPREVAEALQGRPALREAYEMAGFCSSLSVPLVARGRVLGALTVALAGAGGHLGPDDLVLIEDLARRAALALDSARLYAVAERERSTLAEAHRAKDEFLATLSHELRTPLNAMLGWVQLLRTEDPDQATLRRGLETLERNTKAQAQLIEDLLDISRIITGKLALQPRPVQLAPVLESAVEVLRSAANAKGVELVTAIAPHRGFVRGDPDRLQQVVWNLLSNAVKFTPKGGIVRVVLDDDERGARLRVIDNGQGIRHDFLPYVFDRFRQADGTSARAHGGLGLGLAIVRHLIELHGGQVEASSEGLGYGSTFTVTLPIDDGAGTAFEAGADVGPESMAFSSSHLLAGIDIVLVEDEPDGRELLSAVLERSGARVTAVGSAGEAWDVLEREAPTVLLSDIGLPGEDGHSLIRRVRALPPDRGGDVPAAALTAYASAEDGARALAAGFHAHLAKPIEPAVLVRMVAKLARRSPPARSVPEERVEAREKALERRSENAPPLFDGGSRRRPWLNLKSRFRSTWTAPVFHN